MAIHRRATERGVSLPGVPEVQVTATDLADRLRRLADENGDKARELAALNHPHLAAWYQGQREAYLKVIAMLGGGD